MAVTEEGDVTEGGAGTGTPQAATQVTPVDVPPERTALVQDIIKDIKASKDHWAPAFKRMRTCMKLAAHGTTTTADAEAESGSYVVPIINRLINQAVATLYAKNPTSIAKRKKKLLFQIWDGDPASIQAALAAPPIIAPVADPLTGQPTIDPATQQPVVVAQPDPNAAALLAEVQAAKQEMLLYDRMAKTMQLLFAYYFDEQDSGYKEQLKALVRRGKVCGVGYVKLGFQRVLEKRPDIESKIADATDQVAKIEAMLACMAKGDAAYEENSAKTEELKILIENLQSKVEIIVREGPVLSFPRSTEIIPDRDCRHLKTFAGCRRVSQEFEMTPEKILEVYKVDVTGNFTAYNKEGKTTTSVDKKSRARVWEVQDKVNGEVYTVCDGYPDFLKAPAEPDVKIERFWTLFPLVLNEIEDEDEIFPPSDVWNARHMQKEWNSAGQGRREHRIAARPRPVAIKGKLSKEDVTQFRTKEPFEVIELNSVQVGERAEDQIGWLKTPGVDPNLYETSTTMTDLQMSVGGQQANLGGTSGDTATETSIAEQSRMTAAGSDVDDLDTMLTALARAMGQLMLLELTKDTVIEIVGPGAVWPDTPPSREQVVKDLVLGIEAGSSGRPNRAAELANWERAMPYIQVIPGMNPRPWAQKALTLFDMDIEEGYVEGMPSMASLNKMSGTNMQAGAGPNDPNQQGDQGGDNAESTQNNEPQSQPEYTTPQPGTPSV